MESYVCPDDTCESVQALASPTVRDSSWSITNLTILVHLIIEEAEHLVSGPTEYDNPFSMWWWVYISVMIGKSPRLLGSWFHLFLCWQTEGHKVVLITGIVDARFLPIRYLGSWISYTNSNYIVSVKFEMGSTSSNASFKPPIWSEIFEWVCLDFSKFGKSRTSLILEKLRRSMFPYWTSCPAQSF